jgi:hypothetical protein
MPPDRQPPVAETPWYYARGGQPRGPVPLARLRELAAAGQLLPTDRVLRAGTKLWLAAGDVAGLFPQTPAGPAPAARPIPRRRASELPVALVLILAVTGLYALLAWQGAPRPVSAAGYALGIVGFVLMLCTETLYTLRKQVRRLNWGRMNTWLQFHVVTGIVGPYLVLLHSAGHFHGLAGVLALLTVVIVLSGFAGRYVYTAVPRTLDGAEVAVRDLEGRIAAVEQEMQALGQTAGAEALAVANEAPPRGWRLVLARPWLEWRYRRRLHRALRGTPARLEVLLAERHRLRVQIASLAVTRRLLALWHLLHYPLGAAVFTLAFVHVGAALYYAALLK